MDSGNANAARRGGGSAVAGYRKRTWTSLSVNAEAGKAAVRRSQMRLDGGARGAADGVTKARHAALMEVGIEMEVCSGDDGSAADGAGRETNGPSRRKTARSINIRIH